MKSTHSRVLVYQSYFNKQDNVNKGKEKTTKLNTDESNSAIKVITNKTLPANEKTFEPQIENSQNPNFSPKLDSVKKISKLFEKDISNEPNLLRNDSEFNKFNKNKSDETDKSLIFREKIKTYENKIQNADANTKLRSERFSSSARHSESPNLSERIDLTLTLSKSKDLPSIEIEHLKEKTKKEEEPYLKNTNIFLQNDKNNLKNNHINKPYINNKQNKNILNQSSNESQPYLNNNEHVITNEKIDITNDSISVKSLISEYQKCVESSVREHKPKYRPGNSVKNIFDKDLESKKVILPEEYNSRSAFKHSQPIIMNEKNDESIRIPLEKKKTESRFISNNITVESKDTELKNNSPSPETNNIPTSSIRDALRKAKSNSFLDNEIILSEKSEESPKFSNETSIRSVIIEEPSLKEKTKYAEEHTRKSSNIPEKKSSKTPSSFHEELQQKVSKIQIPTDNVLESEGANISSNGDILHNNPTKNLLKEFDTKNKLESNVINENNANASNSNSNVFKYKLGQKSQEEVIADWTRVDEISLRASKEFLSEKDKLKRKKFNTEENNSNSVTQKNFTYNMGNKADTEIQFSKDWINVEEATADTNTKANHISPQNSTKESEKSGTKNNEGNKHSPLELFISKHVENTKSNASKMSSKSKHGATRLKVSTRPNASTYFRQNSTGSVTIELESNTANGEDINDDPLPDYD